MLSYTSSTQMTSLATICFHLRSAVSVFKSTRWLASLALRKAHVIGSCRAAMVWCLKCHKEPLWVHCRIALGPGSLFVSLAPSGLSIALSTCCAAFHLTSPFLSPTSMSHAPT